MSGNNLFAKSDALLAYISVTGSFRAALTNFKFSIFADTAGVLTDPNAAVPGTATLLDTFQNTSATSAFNCQFAATAPGGVLQPTSGQVWCSPTTGGAVANGLALYAIASLSGDTLTSPAGSNFRLLFDVGGDPSYGLALLTPNITIGMQQSLNGAFLLMQ